MNRTPPAGGVRRIHGRHPTPGRRTSSSRPSHLARQCPGVRRVRHEQTWGSSVRVVVTGGAGFIGANLCRVLVERGVDVVVIDDLSTGNRANLDGLPVEFRVASILDPEVLDEVCAEADSIVHLAAVASVPLSLEDPAGTHAANATGTLRVLEAGRRAGAYVVVASSSAVYGDDPSPRKREDLAPRPLSPYAVSKLATEAYATAYQSCFGLPTLAFRFFNVFGPLQPADHVYAAVIPAFISAALAGKPLTVYGDGGQTRDFVYVGTVAALLAEAALERRTHPSPVNLALGAQTTVLELITLLEKVLGSPLERRHLPARAGDVRDSCADDTLLRALFPALAPVSLAEGLAQTVEWFRSVG